MKKQYDCWSCLDGEDPKAFVADNRGMRSCPDCGRTKKSTPSYKGYKESRATLRTWINTRESALWRRKDYQNDLDKLAGLFSIPKGGFKTWDEASTFFDNISSNNLWDVLRHQLGEIVRKHTSKRLDTRSNSRLRLNDEWMWAVYNHLLRREAGREVAKFMVEQMSLPQINIRYGDPRFTKEDEIAAELTIKYKTPEPIVREAKKYLREIERDIQAKRKTSVNS